jgi:hypothetical protein
MKVRLKSLFQLSLVSFVVSMHAVLAQEPPRKISGLVRDAESHQTLPGAYIRVVGINTGTTSNADGAYRLLLPAGTYQIVVSYLGYLADTLRLTVAENGVMHNFELHPSPIVLSEFLVVGDQSNPAEEVIKRAIERKKRLRSRMGSYEYAAYTKLTMRVKVFKRVKDSLVTGEVKSVMKDTILAAGVIETQTKGYWKEPDKFKEVILARKQTRNIAPEVNILGLANIPNLNDDRVKMYEILIVGPTAPNALEFYSYQMIDTTSVNNIAVWRIKMTAKSSTLPLFEGTVTISDETYRLVEGDLYGNDALSHSAPLDSVRVHQRFGYHDDPFLWPLESNLFLRIKFPGFVFPLLVEHIGVVHDYGVNTIIPDSIFDRFSVAVDPRADKVDSAGWSALQAPPLTVDEKGAYRTIDSLFLNNKTFAGIMWIMRFPFWLAEKPFTTLSDYFRFNRVEGAYLGAGYDSRGYLGSTHLVARAGYAFAQEAWKYGLEVEQVLAAGNSPSIGVEIHRSILNRAGEEPFTLGTNTFFTLFGKDDPSDYFEGEGFSLFARQRAGNDLSVEMRYLDERQRSMKANTDFSIFHRSEAYRPNPLILDGHLRSAAILLQYDTRKLIQLGPITVPDETYDSWNITADAEYADRSFLKNDFSFARVSLMIHMRKHLLGDRSFSLYGRAGYAGHGLPPQRLFDLSYGAEGIMPLGAFKTLRVKEFSGDRIGMLMMEWNLSGMFFRHIDIPIVRDMQLILYGGSGWSDLSTLSERIQTVEIQTAKKLFHEAGFALGNLPLGFRLDFTWRLTHRDGRNFQVTLGSSMF